MKHSSIFAIALGALAISCSNQSESGKYTLTATATPDDAGKMAYIMNFDTGDKVDSIVVNGDSIVMSGTVATAIPHASSSATVLSSHSFLNQVT